MKPTIDFKALMVMILLAAGFLYAGAQDDKYADTYACQKGMVHFFSATAMENIDATTNSAICVLNTKTKKVFCKIKQSGFTFKDKLMQEHFNENYMESDKFPKSEFKGAITNMNEVNFAKDGTYSAKVTGKLTIHGVTKDLTVPGTITVSGNTMKASTKFTIKLQDYNITIPSVVADKIAKDATIKLESDLIRK